VGDAERLHGCAICMVCATGTPSLDDIFLFV
jgi:hypothetical protein